MGDEDSRTLYVGNIDSSVTEDLIYELFLQAGPINHVKIPLDRATNVRKPFGFVCYRDESSAPYAFYLLNGTQLSGKTLKVQTRRNTQAIPPMDSVGIHSLDPDFVQSEDCGNISFNKSYGSSSASQINKSGGYLANPAAYPQYPNLTSPLMPMPGMPFNQPLLNNYVSYNSGFQGFGILGAAPPSIDTNSLNNYKNMHDNYNSYNESNKSDYRGHNQYQSNHHDNRPQHNYQQQDYRNRGHNNQREDYRSRDQSRPNSYQYSYKERMQDSHDTHDSHSRSRSRDHNQSSKNDGHYYSQGREYRRY